MLSMKNVRLAGKDGERLKNFKMEIAARDKYNLCFACGQGNPIGLKLAFRFEDGKAKAEFIPGPYHQSWNGIFTVAFSPSVWTKPSGMSSIFRASRG